MTIAQPWLAIAKSEERMCVGCHERMSLTKHAWCYLQGADEQRATRYPTQLIRMRPWRRSRSAGNRSSNVFVFFSWYGIRSRILRVSDGV